MPVKHESPYTGISTSRPLGTARVSQDLGVGAALWESVAGEWKLVKCGCAAGYEVAGPPTHPGQYDGQILKTLCEPVAG
jgi:hypothetical protein